MKSVILAPSGVEQTSGQLISNLAAKLGGLVVEFDSEGRVSIDGVRPEPPGSPSRSRAHDARWPIDNDWFGLLARYAARHVAEAPTSEELSGYLALTQSLVAHRLEEPDVIVAIDNAVIYAALGAFAPFVAVITQVPVAEGEPLPGPFALALHAAPIVVATNLATWFALTNRGCPGVYYCPVATEPPPEVATAESDSEPRPYTVLISRKLSAAPTPIPRSNAAPANMPADSGSKGAGDALRVLGVAAAILADRTESSPAKVVLGGEVHEAIAQAAAGLGIGEALDWIGGTWPLAPAAFRDADLVLVPSADPYELEADVVTAAAFQTPSVVIEGLPFLNSMHQSPAPTVLVHNAESFDSGALATATEAASDWFANERSMEAAVNRLEGLALFVSDYSSTSAPLYSFLQKRRELVYESEVATEYDQKYHAGLCYQRMDRTLASVVSDAIGEVDRPRILDLGCGPGSLIPYLREIPNALVTGVDLSPRMIAVARGRYPSVEFEVGDCEAIPYENGSFDAVLCSGVLHHLPSLSATLEEVRRVLKPGGAFVAREPNDDHFGSRHPRHAFVHLCLRHHLYSSLRLPVVEAPDPHQYHREFQAPDLVEALEPLFLVEGLQTELRVSYFYDMIRQPELFAPVENLEASLKGQPGMNLLVVARKSEERGARPEAKASLANLATLLPVSPEHLATAAAAIEWFEQRAPLRFPTDNGLKSKAWQCIESLDSASVLILSDDPERLASLKDGLPGHGEREFRQLGGYQSSNFDRYDVVLVEAGQRATEEELLEALHACREYGTFYLEVAPRCQIDGNVPEFAHMSVVALAYARPGNRDWNLRCVIVPLGYTTQDARLALKPLLLGLTDRTPGMEELLRNLEKASRRAELTGQFSFLRASGLGRTLRNALDTR